MRLAALALAALMMPAAAPAQTLTGDAAAQLMFQPSRASVAVNPNSGLSAAQTDFVTAIFNQRQVDVGMRYYGSVAVSPSFFDLVASQGPQAAMLAGLFQVTGEMHNVAAADRFALTLCETARTAGQAPCVIAARILPRGYRNRDLTLSASATEALTAYRRASAPKAFAASTATQGFAFRTGANAAAEAMAACNASAQRKGAADCAVVVAD